MRHSWSVCVAATLLPVVLFGQGLDCTKLVPLEFPFLSETSGWGRPEYYTTIQTAKITGQQSLDLVARSAQGILMWTWDAASGTWKTGPAGPPLSDAAGWNSPAYYLTIRLGDIDGDGLDEMIARDANGVHTWKYNPTLKTWAEAGQVLPISATDCVDASCYSTFRMGHLLSQDADSMLYRDRNGVHVYSWRNAQWVSVGGISYLNDSRAFNDEGYYGTINVANVVGQFSSTDQIVYRDYDGLHAYDVGTANDLVMWPALSDHNGYGVAYQTMQWIPLGSSDALVVRALDGLHLFYNDESYNPQNALISTDFTDANGWTEPQYYRSIKAAKLDPNDSKFQITALTPDGLGVWTSNTGTYEWKRVSTYSAVSPASGWSLPQSYLTLQWPMFQGRALFVGRGPSNLVTLTYDPQSGLVPVTKPGFPTVSVAAYQWISEQLPPSNPKNDIRFHYKFQDLKEQWAGYQATVKGLKGVSPPPGVLPADFEVTRQQIEDELGMVPTVINWFQLSGAFIDQMYQPFRGDVLEVQLAVSLSDNSATVAFNWLSGILKILSSIATLGLEPQASGALGIMSTVVSLSASGPSGPGGLNPTVLLLLENLDKQQTNATDANACATDAFVQNWALMKPLNDGVQDRTLSWDAVDQANALDAGHRGYKYWLYQTLTPKAWMIIYSWSLINYGYPTEYRPKDNDWYSIALTAREGPYQTAPVPALDLLFKAAPAGYGTPLYDIFKSRNGWNLPMLCYPNSCPQSDLPQGRWDDVRQSVRRLASEVRRSTADDAVRTSLLEPLEMVLQMIRQSRFGDSNPRQTILEMLQLFQLRVQLHSGSRITASSANAHAASAYGISYLLTDYPSAQIHGASSRSRTP